MSEPLDNKASLNRVRRLLQFRLSELDGDPTLQFARGVYYDVVESAAPDESYWSRNPEQCQAFINAMHLLAQDGELSAVSTWKNAFLTAMGAAHPTAETPPNFLSWDAVADNVTAFLADLQKRLRLFLMKEDYLPVWIPPESWKSVRLDQGRTLHDHLHDLRIPTTSVWAHDDSIPDMLVYKLGDFSAVDQGRMLKRVTQLLEGGVNRILVNASGSGKTRHLFEALCREWGLYFTCAADPVQNPYGSFDMTKMFDIDFVSRRRDSTGRWFKDFDGSSPSTEERRIQITTNVAICEHISSIILLARLLVLGAFAAAFNEVKGTWERMGMDSETIETRARRAWVLLQVFPMLGSSGDICGDATDAEADIFDTLTMLLYDVEEGAIRKKIPYALTAIPRSMRPRLIVFDEVQVVANQWTTAFASGAGNLGRPLLKPLANGIWKHLRRARVLVAGTKLNQRYVEQALSSNVFKNRNGASQFSDFGGYFREVDMWRVLEHFFTPRFVRQLPETVTTPTLYWMRGRHRFMTTFIEWVLREGPQHDSIRNVINNIVYVATAEKIKGFPFSKLRMHMRSLVPENFPTISDYANGWIPRRADTEVVRDVRRGILTFLLHSEFPRFPPRKLELVANGIGRFIVHEDDQSIQISERLVLCSLMNYFSNPLNPDGLSSRTNEMLSKLGSSDEVVGFGFEDASTYLFWDALTGPEPALMTHIFAFQHDDTPGDERDLTPDWARCSARLVRTWSGSEPEIVQRHLTAVICQKARSVEQTLAWFLDENRAPFLKPESHFGADVVFVLRLYDPLGEYEGKLLLVSVTCKAWQTAAGGEKVARALFSSSPEGLWGLSSSKARQDARLDLLQVLHCFFPPLSGNKRPRDPQIGAANNLDQDDSSSDDSSPPPRPRTTSKGRGKKRKSTGAEKRKQLPRVYSDTIDFGVLRCVGAFPDTVRLPNPPTTAQGLYPLAMISEKMMEKGCSFGFDAFEEAMVRVGRMPHVDDEEKLEEENAAFVLPKGTDARTRSASNAEPESDDDVDNFLNWSLSVPTYGEIVEADYQHDVEVAPVTVLRTVSSSDVSETAEDAEEFVLPASLKHWLNDDSDADSEREVDDHDDEDGSDAEDTDAEDGHSAMEIDNEAADASQPTVLDTAVAALELDTDDEWGTQESEEDEELAAPATPSIKRKASSGIDKRVSRRRLDQ